MDNADFHEDNYELGRIIRNMSKIVRCYENEGLLRDMNGNVVGKWIVK